MPDDDCPSIADRLAAAAEADPAWLAAHRPAKPDQPAGVQAKASAESGDQTPDECLPPEDGAGDPPSGGTPAGGGDIDDSDPELRNELADADRLVRDMAGKAWFCPQRASTRKGDLEAGWLVWDGKRLRPSEDGAILRLAKATALALSAEYLELAKTAKQELEDELACDPVDRDAVKGARAKLARLLSRADQVQTEHRLHTMISLARWDPRVLIDQRDLDAGTAEYRGADILNCQNGVLHLPTLRLLPHDPAYRCTKITAVPYKADADRSALMRLLNRACMVKQKDGTWATDADRIRYLQDAIGAGLYGHQELQRFYLCLGNGGDGKGTLFEALLDALGGGHDGYAMKAATQSFVREKISGHKIRDDLANMAGARLVLTSEINKGEALDAALVKTLSGEDTQRVRHLFGKEFEFRPVCTLFMQANHEPYVDSSDDAIWRRLVKIPFGPSLREDERDPAVRRSLHDPETGGAALLSWAAEGAQRTYRAKRLEPTDSVTKATQAYRDEMNPLAGFLVDELRFANAAKAKETWVEQRAIRPAFEAWQTDAGVDDKKGPGVSGKRVGQQLRECGAWPGSKFIGGKTRKVWFGVTLRHDHPAFAETCLGTFVPSEDMHRAQVAASAPSVVLTSLPHPPVVVGAGAPEMPRACAGGISSPTSREPPRERGNEVSKPGSIPDLDDLNEPPF